MIAEGGAAARPARLALVALKQAFTLDPQPSPSPSPSPHPNACPSALAARHGGRADPQP